MDKKQIKLFCDSLMMLAKILMGQAPEEDSEYDIANRLVDGMFSEFLFEDDEKEIRKYLEYLNIKEN